jgi:hypothetical protein
LNSPSKASTLSNVKRTQNKSKKLTPYSPNTRYQNVQKLSMSKKSSAPSKKYKSSNKKFNPKKKRKYKGSAFKNNKYNPVRRKR